VAKENLVATLAVLYGLGDGFTDGTEPQLVQAIQAAFTPAAAMAYLLFNLFCVPCIAAMGAIKREMVSWKWTLFAFFYQCTFAYVIAFLVYQIGSRLF
jgi:ferrous iron transport protein B